MAQLGDVGAGVDPLLGNVIFEAGDILFWPNDSLPEGGWAWCDGAELSRTEHAGLFAAIGTDHGAGDGATTFNVPDLRQRHPAGSSVDAAGGAGGQVDHVHGAGSLSQKSHSHPRGSLYVPGHGHGHFLSAPQHDHPLPMAGPYALYDTAPVNDGTRIPAVAVLGNPGPVFAKSVSAPGLSGGIYGSGDLAASGSTASGGGGALTGQTAPANAPFIVVRHAIKL